MPKKGFSIDDLLNQKPRKYQEEYKEKPKPFINKVTNGISEARKVLKVLGIDSIPTPLELVCEYYGAYVVEINTIPENPRAVGRYLGDGKIEIKKDLHENLYRTTLAHELGHLALFHDIRSKWHEAESYKDHDPHEKEAWDFAGELLLPDKLLKPLFKKNHNSDQLAKDFKVSSTFLWVQIDKRKYL